MRFILISVIAGRGSDVDLIMDECLKEIPYASKIKNDSETIFSNAMLRYDDLDGTFIKMSPDPAFGMEGFDDGIAYSAWSAIRKAMGKMIDANKRFRAIFKRLIDDDDIDIFYTDGSFMTRSEYAGFSCCKVHGRGVHGDDAAIDELTGESRSYEMISGRIPEGTNNIGELTAIKTAVENHGDHDAQVIISDSMYGIKCFREYIHVWMRNGYKTSGKKPIKNEMLIKETNGKIDDLSISGKIVLFMWTKGHDGQAFNELCDRAAKAEIGG